MSNEWSVERLDALPEWTLITWSEDDGYHEGVSAHKLRKPGAWDVHYYGGDTVYSEGIIAEADPGSIRVVSVPVDALLSEGAVGAAHQVIPGVHPDIVREVLRAAIAHITAGDA